ncbi:serine protease [Motiliproteus sp. SC1-56]|uniref:S1 family peptidase n=1 Tax=Motiliproteus sp. SC1-56 TaxID=2799565 RepID=UPI001A8D9631|nr:serine protease [Motiliproteus sp. SC1-56]
MEIESILLCATQVSTFLGQSSLTNATGFFFQRDENLFLATSRHVFFDAKSNHSPDRIVIKLHTDRNNAARAIDYSIPLYVDGKSQWISGFDRAGDIDVAVIQIFREQLPKEVVFEAFGPQNLLAQNGTLEIGTPLLIVGFPLGFHDTLHNLPVARSAINASSFALRFQGNGYFLTDARTHRGSSGAPVVCKNNTAESMPWLLLGIHSGRLDMTGRDTNVDEALGLNCAWFADILLTLTEPTKRE